jgi:hypothetical protein
MKQTAGIMSRLEILCDSKSLLFFDFWIFINMYLVLHVSVTCKCLGFLEYNSIIQTVVLIDIHISLSTIS